MSTAGSLVPLVSGYGFLSVLGFRTSDFWIRLLIRHGQGRGGLYGGDARRCPRSAAVSQTSRSSFARLDGWNFA